MSHDRYETHEHDPNGWFARYTAAQDEVERLRTEDAELRAALDPDRAILERELDDALAGYNATLTHEEWSAGNSDPPTVRYNRIEAAYFGRRHWDADDERELRCEVTLAERHHGAEEGGEPDPFDSIPF